MFDSRFLRELDDALKAWEQSRLAADLAKMPERRREFTTLSGIPVGRVYTPLDVPKLNYQRDLGLPGEYPFTRGIHATMYRSRLWTMRLFSGFGSVEETNSRFKYLLEHGETGLSVAFDLPTLYGRDLDDPHSQGEFGQCGVNVSSLEDMEILFQDIPMDRITTSMTINGPAAIIWAMYIVAAEKKGIPRSALGGTIQNDILKEYMSQNEFIFPPEPSMRLVVDTIEFASLEMPKWNPISISGYHIREAGSTAVQELAFTLANGFTYVQWCLDRGLDIDSFAPRLSFFFNCHNNFFEEIAKFRAARRIWAREMRHRFGARNPRSWWLRFHTQTAGCSLTKQQPEVNIVRTALQALAAVLGGTQSLHTNSMDEAIALPSEKAARLALRTQQVIAHETGVADVVDPLGGSYFLEALTDEIERRAYQYFARIDELGGVIAGIHKDFFLKEIADAAYQYEQEIQQRQRIVVGVNEYIADEPIEIPILHIDPEGERRQRARLEALRLKRDNSAVAASLRRVREAAAGTENLMYPIIEAVKAYATLGEITGAMKTVFGEYKASLVV
jgi:methylmalonyl-CoA mutase N-terminal domain/subunit